MISLISTTALIPRDHVDFVPLRLFCVIMLISTTNLFRVIMLISTAALIPRDYVEFYHCPFSA